MGKLSTEKMNLDESFMRQKRWRDKIKPPYLCPVCSNERTVHVKKEKLLQTIEVGGKKKTISEYRFHIYCQRGCFRTSFTYSSEVYEPVDVYCNLVDNILKEKEVKNP